MVIRIILSDTVAPMHILDDFFTHITLALQTQSTPLLIREAATSRDSTVRAEARAALFEYGESNAHAMLESYLESEEGIQDEAELEGLLDDLALPSIRELRKKLANGS